MLDKQARQGTQAPGCGCVPMTGWRSGKGGEDILATLLCPVTHSHGHRPASTALAQEACAGHLPGMASATGQSQMNSLRGRRAWHLECGFWDERTVPFWLVRAKKTQAGHTPPLSLTFPAVKWGCREDSRRPVHGTRSVPGKTVC